MTDVLFSRPKHDTPMEYLYYYSGLLIKEGELIRNIKIINKEKQNSTRRIINEVLRKINPRLIMFNGHGTKSSICGHNNEPIIDKENISLLNGSIIYALACCAGAELGETAKDIGADCFIGYKYEYAIAKDPEYEASPRKDKIAKFFLEPSNLLFSSIMNGQTVDSAVKKAKRKMKLDLGYLNTTKDMPYAKHYAAFLFGNYSGLVICGNKDAKI